MLRQVASICLKALPSLGICFMISSELKIGSRYSHLPCHMSHMMSRHSQLLPAAAFVTLLPEPCSSWGEIIVIRLKSCIVPRHVHVSESEIY